MQKNTHHLKNISTLNIIPLTNDQLAESLSKWLKQPKKNKKQPKWNTLLFSLKQLIISDIELNQLLVDQEFFFDKIYYLANLCKYRTENLFNGVEIKLNEAFMALNSACKLQKVIVEGSQIKQVTPVDSFSLIKRADMTCEDRKRKMLIYNRQKNQRTAIFTIELKVIERVKNDIFKQDHSNKLKLFSNHIFGDGCPSYCASGINILQLKENQWLKQKVNIDSNNVYIIYHGTVVCFIQNVKQKENEGEQNDKSMVVNSIKTERQKIKRNNSLAQKDFQKFLNKVQLNKGSIIQTQGFSDTMKKLGKPSSFRFQSCKAIQNCIIFELKVSEFSRAIFCDEKCKKHFLNQYEKILFSRQTLFQKSLNTVNGFFNKCPQLEQSQICFSISRRKGYRGFSSKSSRVDSIEEMQNLATVQIYDMMIKNKQKVLSLQNQYKNRSKTSQKVNLRYEDNKKIKENYKRMKIKDFQIQKLAFGNSFSNIKDPNGLSNIKNRLCQVKGMFQDQIQQVEKVIKEQRKAMLDVQSNKVDKKFKRKGIRLKSYSPETSFQNKVTKEYKTCANSKRISIAQSITSSKRQSLIKNNNVNFCSNLILQSKDTIQTDQEKQNFKSGFQILINGCKDSSNKFLYNPLQCVNNLVSDTRRKHKRAKTNFKPQMRRSSSFCPSKQIIC